jgi:hypothetical protein
MKQQVKQKMKMGDSADVSLTANIEAKDGLKLRGLWHIECFDVDGNLKWEELAYNLVTNEGLDHILDVQFHGTTQVNPWYVGLKGAGAMDATDTLASHANWTEETNYAGTRKEFVEGAASSQTISNTGNAASFTMSAAYTAAGAFLASVTSGTGGILFCGIDFSTARSGDSPDVINVTYTLSSADA